MSIAMTQFTASPPARRGLLAGVCAAFAALIGIPAWMIRIAAVLVLLWHPIAAMVVYFALAGFIHHRGTRLARRLAELRDDIAPPHREPPRNAALDGLAARFVALDLRLARLETRFADPDSLLRRRFDRL
ncbi:MAG: PspC domain-containing protein [Acidiphilium sp.]